MTILRQGEKDCLEQGAGLLVGMPTQTDHMTKTRAKKDPGQAGAEPLDRRRYKKRLSMAMHKTCAPEQRFTVKGLPLYRGFDQLYAGNGTECVSDAMTAPKYMDTPRSSALFPLNWALALSCFEPRCITKCHQHMADKNSHNNKNSSTMKNINCHYVATFEILCGKKLLVNAFDAWHTPHSRVPLFSSHSPVTIGARPTLKWCLASVPMRTEAPFMRYQPTMR